MEPPCAKEVYLVMSDVEGVSGTYKGGERVSASCLLLVGFLEGCDWPMLEMGL